MDYEIIANTITVNEEINRVILAMGIQLFFLKREAELIVTNDLNLVAGSYRAKMYIDPFDFETKLEEMYFTRKNPTDQDIEQSSERLKEIRKVLKEALKKQQQESIDRIERGMAISAPYPRSE